MYVSAVCKRLRVSLPYISAVCVCVFLCVVCLLCQLCVCFVFVLSARLCLSVVCMSIGNIDILYFPIHISIYPSLDLSNNLSLSPPIRPCLYQSRDSTYFLSSVGLRERQCSAVAAGCAAIAQTRPQYPSENSGTHGKTCQAAGWQKAKEKKRDTSSPMAA